MRAFQYGFPAAFSVLQGFFWISDRFNLLSWLTLTLCCLRRAHWWRCAGVAPVRMVTETSSFSLHFLSAGSLPAVAARRSPPSVPLHNRDSGCSVRGLAAWAVPVLPVAFSPLPTEAATVSRPPGFLGSTGHSNAPCESPWAGRAAGSAEGVCTSGSFPWAT